VIMHMQKPDKPCTLRRFRREDLVDTVIGPVAAEAAAGGLKDTEDDTVRVAKYLQRYQDVQRHRLNMQVHTSALTGFALSPADLKRAVQHCEAQQLLCCGEFGTVIGRGRRAATK